MAHAALAHDRSGFDTFEARIAHDLLGHRVITDNRYCAWFAAGQANPEDVRDLTRQFSVFSNQFLIAQTQKVIHAASLAEMRQAKEILANELGVVFRPKGTAGCETAGIDPEIVGVEGTVDGGTFRFRAAHFEWLVHFAEPLGLGFCELGRRALGTPATLAFCDTLIRLYGNPDPNIAAGASFAVENWAAAGFWKQLIAGLEAFERRHGLGLNLSFFRWHDRIEDQHAAHTHAELEELWLGADGLDEDRFIAAGSEILDGVAVFWDDLDATRRERA